MEKNETLMSDSLKAAEIRLQRITRIIQGLFARVEEVKESERKQLVDRFLTLVNSHSGESNKKLLMIAANELMQPAPKRIEVHGDLRRKLLRLALALYRFRFANRKESKASDVK